jgi:peptide/nickel transport system ATP-binding protein
MLERIGIERAADRLEAYPHAFSGGMRQRIMIASVMLLRPALVIADEPTTALDSITQREVLDLLRDLISEVGSACLLISHDLPLVTAYADRVMVLQKGQLIEEGDSNSILRRPAKPYTAELVAAIPVRRPSVMSMDSQTLVEVRAATVHFGSRRQRMTAVSDVDLDLRRKETLAIVGASGSGKTTLARAILGLAPLSSGRISLFGQDLARVSRKGMRDIRGRIQFVYQDPYSSLDPRMTVADLVAEPLRHEPSLSAAQKADRVATLIDRVGLTPFHFRKPAALSGGQRQRVAIARAIVRHPDVIVADEPVAALDATVQKQVLALLAELKAACGFSLLFISHDLGVVDAIADRIAVMQGGQIVEMGRKEDVIDHPSHPYTKRLIAVSFALGASGVGGHGCEGTPDISKTQDAGANRHAIRR